MNTNTFTMKSSAAVAAVIIMYMKNMITIIITNTMMNAAVNMSIITTMTTNAAVVAAMITTIMNMNIITTTTTNAAVAVAAAMIMCMKNMNIITTIMNMMNMNTITTMTTNAAVVAAMITTIMNMNIITTTTTNAAVAAGTITTIMNMTNMIIITTTTAILVAAGTITTIMNMTNMIIITTTTAILAAVGTITTIMNMMNMNTITTMNDGDAAVVADMITTIMNIMNMNIITITAIPAVADMITTIMTIMNTKLTNIMQPARRSRCFILENLGCANCAAKMERRINELDDVADATITFATKQLRISGTHLDALVPQIQEICASIESEVKVVPKTPVTKNGGESRVYILENLGCANCAAKMERRINELDDVAEATITFSTKQLRITGKRLDSLLPQIQEICASIESEVKVVPKDPAPKAAAKAENKKDEKAEQKKTLTMIAAGAVLFVIGEVMEHMGVNGYAPAIVNVIAYLILGLEIVITAVKNLTHGQVFDENFLMSIATLGAFAVGDFSEAVGVMLFYRIGEFFEDVAVERSRTQIMDAVDLRPETVNLVSGNDIRVIPAEETEVGDVLLVRPGDRIPLDGTILEGDSRLDTSAITGEPVPVTVKKGDEIVSGCVNVSGQLKIRVDKPLSESMVTRILDSVENAAASKPKIDRFITRFARVYTPFVVILALATAIIPSLVSGNWYYWVHTALTFLVISCPCALVLSVPLAFFSGIGAGSKKGILFKGGISLEQLHNVKAVVMDKTGTITEGNFVVQEVVSAGSLSSDELLALAAGCEQISTHPIATSIVTAAQEKGLSLVKPAKLEEIAGHGISAETGKGTLLVGNRKLMDQFHIDLSAYQKKGFGSEVLIALNGKFEGHIVISDTIKTEAKSAIAALKKLGITTAMLTGDAQESADAVAAETGIDEVHAKLLPQDKLTELQKIRAAHTSVMFVGDGINDAPVLAGADVGAAMGSGADAAIEAADVVFMNSNMDAIPQAIRIAHATSAISWQNVVFALAIKAIVMILGLTGHASMWFAVFADTGVAMLCILNSVRILYKK